MQVQNRKALVKNKKFIILLSLLFLFVLGIKVISKHYRNTDTILGRISILLNRDNYVEVNLNGIKPNEIEIKWNSEVGNSNSIYKNGKKNNKIGHHYGVNTFEVYYEGKILMEPFHFKTNNWHSHEYHFDIENRLKDVIVKFEAIGPNPILRIDTVRIKE